MAVAEYVCRCEPESLPQEVRHQAVRSFVNWAGCCLGGCTHEAVETTLACVRGFAGPAIAPIIGRKERIDPLHAALLNCMSSAVHTFDDTHLRAIIHPGGPVISAAMALAATRHVSGKELAHALALGIEISCRIGNMFMVPPARSNLGLFMTGIAGTIGAAVAAGKLLALDQARMVYAIGLASTQASGLREMHGTMASSFVCGNASRAGLLSALLASKGFTSGRRGIDGSKGLAQIFGAPAHLPAVTEGLGETFEMLLVAHKPYPCGIAIFPSIDACLELKSGNGVTSEDIVTVELDVHPVALHLTGRKAPADALEAQVSLFHWVAASLLHGKAGLPQAHDECVRDPRVITLRERISVRADESLAPEAAVAVVALRDGRIVKSRVEKCRGSPGRPLDDDELSIKFLDQAYGRLEPQSARIALEACFELMSYEDMSDFNKLGFITAE